MKLISTATNVIRILEEFDVDIIFGIPGVHTVEMYRDLKNSRIKHVTARHEQGAGFMADGYARVSGKPGVCLVITGPGVTNILTPMAQARADSIPLLIISTINSSNREISGLLHELPNQEMLVKQVALASFTVKDPEETNSIFQRAFSILISGRPGPVHVQIPVKILKQPVKSSNPIIVPPKLPKKFPSKKIKLITNKINQSKKPLILIGGGARSAKLSLVKLIEKLECPLISTINARDIIGLHRLHIPASPSLAPVREVITNSDLVIAVGTEIGQTDYDMFEDGLFPQLDNLIRVDVDQKQLNQSPPSSLKLQCDAGAFCNKIIPHIEKRMASGSERITSTCNETVKYQLSKDYKSMQLFIETIVNNAPNAIIVGDSTQPTYVGNLYCELSKNNRWFNSATGFGTLGYAIPASLGAKFGAPEKHVICIIGDGGFQFTLTELGVARDENINVFFIVWNNQEYKEIRMYMESHRIHPIGTSPKPPELGLIATSYGIQYQKPKSVKELSELLLEFKASAKSMLVEINETEFQI